MKPLLSKTSDSESLQILGRASLQIVHDLKNQLNGLKLYATFLRKRIEKSERPADEQETVSKLIAGLDRAATDLSTLVRYGSPIELKRQPGVDIQKMMRSVVAGIINGGGLDGLIAVEEGSSFVGEFDPTVLTEALKSISLGALKFRQARMEEGQMDISLRRDTSEAEPTAIIEWRGVSELDHDPFRSFAGSDEVRMSLAAKVIEAHGGSAEYQQGMLRARLPLQAGNKGESVES
jgi:light-regulated signal transduction histidine kinase (bacteriophytochrome)